jgi:arginase
MKIDILQVPYHLDRAGVNTGAGPAHLLESGLREALIAGGHEVGRVEAVGLDRDHGHETGNIFAVAKELAELVRSSRREGAFPLVLAGDCYSVIGVVSGLEEGHRRGLVWFDAHGDAQTPETTATGFFDGMPLAVALGWCWSSLAGTLPGFESLGEQRVVHLGGRAFDDGEEAALAASGMTFINGDTMRAEAGVAKSVDAVTRLGQESEGVHVHLDLDVLDESDGIASGYAVGGGPSLAGLRETISAIGSSGEVVGMTICSYDPAFDEDGRAAAAGISLLTALLAGVGQG